MDIEIKKNQKGFTLIELMIVVAIIGILAAVAVPAYQDYISRAKITGTFSQLDMMKTTLSEQYLATAKMPAATSKLWTDLKAAMESEVTIDNISSYAVSTTTLTDDTATIQVTMNDAEFTGMTAGTDDVLEIILTGSANGVAFDCQGNANTTVKTKWLPANCR